MNDKTEDNKIMSKEDFRDIIEKLQNINDFEDNIYEITRSFNCYNKEEATFEFPTLDYVVVDLLEYIFHDTSENISWWCWEKDFGRKIKKGDITDVNGNEIDISSVNKLYDFLVSEYDIYNR